MPIPIEVPGTLYNSASPLRGVLWPIRLGRRRACTPPGLLETSARQLVDELSQVLQHDESTRDAAQRWLAQTTHAARLKYAYLRLCTGYYRHRNGSRPQACDVLIRRTQTNRYSLWERRRKEIHFLGEFDCLTQELIGVGDLQLPSPLWDGLTPDECKVLRTNLETNYAHACPYCEPSSVQQALHHLLYQHRGVLSHREAPGRIYVYEIAPGQHELFRTFSDHVRSRLGVRAFTLAEANLSEEQLPEVLAGLCTPALASSALVLEKLARALLHAPEAPSTQLQVESVKARLGLVALAQHLENYRNKLQAQADAFTVQLEEATARENEGVLGLGLL